MNGNFDIGNIIEKIKDEQINNVDELGNTLLHYCAYYSVGTIYARILITRGANPNIKNNNEQTALDIAQINCDDITFRCPYKIFGKNREKHRCNYDCLDNCRKGLYLFLMNME